MADFPNLSSAKVLVVDTETTGLNWRKDEVVGYAIATEDRDWYFPVRHDPGGNLDVDSVEAWVRDSLSRFSGRRVVGHALKFDLHMLDRHNIHVPADTKLECTQVNFALIDENHGRYDLESTCKYFGTTAKKGMDLYVALAYAHGGTADRKQMANFYKMPGDHPLAHEYARGDARSTFDLWKAQQAHLDEEDLRRVWEVECRCIRTLFRMERRGIRVSEEKLKLLRAWVEDQITKAEKVLPPNFNVRSSTAIRAYLEGHDRTDWPMTAPSMRFPEGQPSFTEKWLSTIPEGQPIIRLRKLSNLINSFIDPLASRHLVDGRVHCSFNQTKMDDYGTVSGRLSSSEPNLQQVPKRDKELAPRFRDLFLPEPHCLWSANDYSQQELRIFADYTKSKVLVEGYRSDPPVDAHSTVADLLSVERDPTAKRMNLGMIYNMGVQTLAGSLDVEVQIAKRYRKAYDDMIPEARQFNKDAEKAARRRGHVFSKLGRRCRLTRQIAHKAGNRVIQSTSADVTKLKMVEVDEYFAGQGDECSVMLQVHDDLNWSFHPDLAQQDQIAREIMVSFGSADLIQLDVPMVVDHGEAETWGKATFPNFKWEDTAW